MKQFMYDLVNWPGWWGVRKGIYITATLASVGWGAYEVTGDPKDAIAPTLAALIALMAAAKTKRPV